MVIILICSVIKLIDLRAAREEAGIMCLCANHGWVEGRRVSGCSLAVSLCVSCQCAAIPAAASTGASAKCCLDCGSFPGINAWYEKYPFGALAAGGKKKKRIALQFFARYLSRKQRLLWFDTFWFFLAAGCFYQVYWAWVQEEVLRTKFITVLYVFLREPSSSRLAYLTNLFISVLFGVQVAIWYWT